MEKNSTSNEIAFHEFLHSALGNWKLIVFCISIGMLGASIYYFKFPSYSSEASIIVPINDLPTFPELGAIATSNPIARPIDKYYSFLNSFRFHLEIAEILLNEEESSSKFFLDQIQITPSRSQKSKNNDFFKLSKKEELANILSKIIKINDPSSDTYTFKVTANNPELALFLANRVATEAANLLKINASQEIMRKKEYVSLNLKKSEKRIKEYTDNLIKTQKESKLFPGSGLEYIESFFELQHNLKETEILKNQNDALIDSLTLEFKNKNLPLNHEAADQLIKKYRYGLINRVEKLKEQNKKYNMAINTYKTASDLAEKKVSVLSQVREILEDYKRKLTLEYSVFENLKIQMVRLDFEQIALNGRVRILDLATPSRIISSTPFVFFLIATGLIALFFVFSLIYILEIIAPTLKSPSDFKKIGIPLLATIPNLKKEISGNEKSICRFQLDSKGSFSFRYLRNNLFSILKRKSQISSKRKNIISVLSANESEGKSFISLNLAVAISMHESKVLLIDGDLSRRKISKSLGNNSKLENGLIEYLEGSATLDQCIKPSFTQNLDVLLVNRSESFNKEWFSGQKFNQLLENVKEKYDYVIFDTPPINQVSDSQQLAAEADIILLIANANKTKASSYEEAINRVFSSLPESQASTLYAVLNNAFSYNLNYSYHSYTTSINKKITLNPDDTDNIRSINSA